MNVTNHLDIDQLVNSFQCPFNRVHMTFYCPNPLGSLDINVCVQHDLKELKRRILQEASEDQLFESYTFNALQGILKDGFHITWEQGPPCWSYYSVSDNHFDFDLHYGRIVDFCKKKNEKRGPAPMRIYLAESKV